MRFRLLRPFHLILEPNGKGRPQYFPAGSVIEVGPHFTAHPHMEPLDAEAVQAIETAKWRILSTTEGIAEIPSIGSRQTLER